MLSEDDRREVKEVIRECFSEILSEQGLSSSEIANDHHYIKSIKGIADIIRRASLWTLVSTLLAAFIWSIIHKW